VSFQIPLSRSEPERFQRRLILLAGVFLFLYSVVLTLSPAVRAHTWAVSFRWQHWIGFAGWLSGFTLLHRQIKTLLPDRDPYILPIAGLLTGWGLLTIWRLDPTFGMRQTLWLILGFLVVFLIARFPKSVELLKRYKYIWLSLGLLLTALTFIFGRYPGGDGPRLWLGCCGIYLQPSEPLKLLLIIYLAAYLAGQLYITLSLGQLLAPTLIMAGAATVLLVAQRDLGTAILIIAIYTVIVYLASGRKRVLLISTGLMIIAGVIGYSVFPVIKVRVDAWINPWLDPAGNSYQLVQSFISVATGRIFGTGPGLGSPGLVPVSHSDFIAASISEETGLMGLVALLLLIGIFIFRTLSIGMRAGNNFHRFLASGLGMYFGLQSVLIIGGNLRMLPLTGVTLPFVSYGGSSLLIAYIALGILLVISNGEVNVVPELPRLRPYLVTGGLASAALVGLAIAAGWWAVARSDDLQFRTDNLRWTIHSRFVPRGSLLDRSNKLITVTEGKPGSLTRTLLYPDLGTTVGYSDAQFGKGGLEASLDGYLTGLQGNAASTIWMAELLYGQPPDGMDVRLTIDLNLQSEIDRQLGDRIGAAVVINSVSGEVLAVTSQPSFDPNSLDENWETWRLDPNAPLLNRVTQGQYPLGSIIGPFLYARQKPVAIDIPEILTFTLDDRTLICADVPAVPISWDHIVAAGCPGALAKLGAQLTVGEMRELMQSLGFYDAPVFELETAPASIDTVGDPVLSALGMSDLKVTPLQLVLAVAQLSNEGIRPYARLAMAVDTPHQGWVVLPGSSTATSMPGFSAVNKLSLKDPQGLPIWEAVGKARTQDGKPVTWYISSTLNSWPGTPFSLVLVLEENDTDAAIEIGRQVMRSAISPH